MTKYAHTLGVIGNVWWRQNVLVGAGAASQGHRHHFDHLSLLTKGTVRVEVAGMPAKEFTAPAAIIVKKEHMHKFTCLSDDAVWFCVFALRDEDGGQTDLWNGDNSPYAQITSDGYSAEAAATLEAQTTQHED